MNFTSNQVLLTFAYTYQSFYQLKTSMWKSYIFINKTGERFVGAFPLLFKELGTTSLKNPENRNYSSKLFFTKFPDITIPCRY